MAEDQKQNIEEKTKPIFRNLTADDPEPETTEIESLCMNCEQNVWYYYEYTKYSNNKIFLI